MVIFETTGSLHTIRYSRYSIFTFKLVFKEYLTPKCNAGYIDKSSSMHGNVFIDIVSKIVKVLHKLGEESHNSNKLNNSIETSYVPYRRNILIEVDITYGQFDQNEQPFRTKAEQISVTLAK